MWNQDGAVKRNETERYQVLIFVSVKLQLVNLRGLHVTVFNIFKCDVLNCKAKLCKVRYLLPNYQPTQMTPFLVNIRLFLKQISLVERQLFLLFYSDSSFDLFVLSFLYEAVKVSHCCFSYTVLQRIYDNFQFWLV